MNRTLSQQVGSSLTAVVIVVLGTLLATGIVYSQSTEQSPPPIIGWGFDEFHIGGESLYHPGICSRQLNMDFTYHYGGYSSWWQLNDPSRWGSTPRRAYDFRDMVLHADTVGMKLIYSPDEIFLTWPRQSFLSIENYFGSQFNKISVRDFRDTLVWTDPVVDSVFWIPKRYVAAVAVKGGVSTGDSLLIAGAQRFSNGPLQFAGGDGGFYWRDVLGLPADSSFLHDVTATIRADESIELFNELDDTTTLAYVKLYRRVTEGQDSACPTCHCNWFVQWGPTLNITKGMYVAAPFEDSVRAVKFKDFTFTIDFRQTIKGTEQFVGKSVMPANYDATTNTYCGRLFDTLQGLGLIPDSTFNRPPVEGSDFYYAVYTTRRVPISFMRMRLAQHLFDYLLRPVRYDSSYLLPKYFLTPLDTLMRDPKLWPMMAYITSIDEPHDETFGSYRIFASMIQRHMMENVHPNNTSQWRGLSANPIGGYGTLRILSGDFDTLAYKPASLIITHSYPIIAQPPAFYADKGKMDTTTWNEFYSGCYRSTPTDYLRYTKTMNDTTHLYGNPVWNNFMIKKSTNCDAIDDAQFKYEDLGRPKIPVYNNIQVAGYMKIQKDSSYWGFIHQWGLGGQRPSTVEEITGQTWLSMNCGNQGVMFSDLIVTGDHMGLFTRYGTWGVPDDSIYARLEDYGDYVTGDSVQVGPTWTIPKMWTGNKQRFDAIKNVTAALKRIDTLYTQLEYKQEQISVERSQDPPGPFIKIVPFQAMPLVDSAYTIMAQRWERPDSVGRYKDSLNGSTPVTDSIHRTYLEITHFSFKNQQRNATGERVLIITNRRLWPTDWDHDSTNPYWDGNYGLGAIDVRLPVLRLKNTTGVVADSFIVERVGESYAWRDTGAFGQDLKLQWLEPGWGAMYRIIPLASGVSQFGTAFNNGVRSENPSTNATAKDRLVVYEREGNIFLRTNDSTGQWSVEHRISDLADTLRSNGTRSAVNINPTLATSRNSNALLVTWERKTVSSNQSRVRAAYFSSLPTRTSFPTPTYYNLSNSVSTSDSWKRLTPVVTGVPGGWLVAWAKCSGSYGIDLMAIRNPGSAPSTTTDFSAIQNAKALTIKAYASCTYPLDSIALFPTVAFAEGKYVCRYSFTSNAFNFRDTVVHLAYQQGTPDVANQQFIIYHQIGVDIPDTSIAPSVTVFRAEHVSENLPGCGFLHPSIAVDKKGEGIGVAFQANSLTKRQTVLRMRGNGVLYAGLCVTGPWNTTAYTWGGKDRWYEWPALTKFPKQTFAVSDPRTGDGGLVWEWTNRTDQRTMQFFYRFGWPRPDSTTLPFGQDPTLTLAPYVTTNPFAYSSVFYRGDTATRFVRQTVASGVTSTLYPAALENTPAIRSKLFSTTPNNRNIRSEMIIKGPAVSDCIFPRFDMGIDHWWDIYVEHDGRIINDPRKPGLPPTFFPTDTTVPIDILTLSNAAAITRTSTFKAGTTPVNVRWRAQGNSALVSWLDTQPYDSTLNRPADILLMMELVKASDSTVLWRSDTVTARDVDSDTLMEVIEVPVQAMAPLDTNVFIRLRAVATEDLEFDLSAGFSFVDGDSTSPLLWKVQRWFGEVGEEKNEAALQTAVIPNPTTTDNVEIRLQVQEPGTVRIGFYTMLGQQIVTLPDIEIARAGVYLQEFDLSTMQPGIYLLVAEQGKHKASTKVTVIRQ